MILFIDDNVSFLTTFTKLLKTTGFCDVMTAASGEDGVYKASIFQPKTVIVDIGLPGMSGIDVCKKIAHDTSYPKPFIIALTAFCHPDMLKDLDNSPFDRVLIKPISINDIVSIIGAPKINYRPLPMSAH